jgi:hypothetical protein
MRSLMRFFGEVGSTDWESLLSRRMARGRLGYARMARPWEFDPGQPRPPGADRKPDTIPH